MLFCNDLKLCKEQYIFLKTLMLILIEIITVLKNRYAVYLQFLDLCILSILYYKYLDKYLEFQRWIKLTNKNYIINII